MNLHIIRSEDYDWIALYRDGKMLHQGHSIQEEDMLNLLGFEAGHTVATDDQLDEWGGECPYELPENFS